MPDFCQIPELPNNSRYSRPCSDLPYRSLAALFPAVFECVFVFRSLYMYGSTRLLFHNFFFLNLTGFQFGEIAKTFMR